MAHAVRMSIAATPRPGVPRVGTGTNAGADTYPVAIHATAAPREDPQLAQARLFLTALRAELTATRTALHEVPATDRTHETPPPRRPTCGAYTA